jgi:uncharacterized protein YydD (DUF2326 family)
MIHRLFSSHQAFKTLRFKNGVNILLADRAESSSDTDTRNGAGKTTAIDLVHFLLGGEWSHAHDSVLQEDVFGLEFDLAGRRVTVRRSGRTHSRVFFDGTPETVHWPIQPERRADGLSMNTDDWSAVLGQLCFGLPAELHDETFRPNFRNLFSYFARRIKHGGFFDPQSIHRHQQLWDQQVCVTYLLGLDWTIPADMQRIRLKEKARQQLRKLLAEDEGATLREFLPDSAELRTRLTLAERRGFALRQSLSSFRVIEQYHELESEADQLTTEINALADENTVDRQIITDLEQALAAEAPPGSGELGRVYTEAGLTLPEQTLRRFDEVRSFHESVIRNRRAYLDNELRALRRRMATRNERVVAADARRAQVLSILQTSGALESFTQLQEEYTRVHTMAETIRRQHEHALQFENVGRELAIERAQLETRMAQNQFEQAEQIERAVVIFADISRQLYRQPGELTVSRSLSESPIRVEIPRKESEGVSSMQIFCFDLTMMQLMADRRIGPGFLIHDSHLFDGVDARQIANAIRVAASTASALSVQYITALNTDVAAEVRAEGDLDVYEYALQPVLSDEEGGGLLGKPFGDKSGPPPERRRRNRAG